MNESASSEVDLAAALDAHAARELRARQALEDIRVLFQAEYECLCYPFNVHPWDLLMYEQYRARLGVRPRPPYAGSIEACYQAVQLDMFA